MPLDIQQALQMTDSKPKGCLFTVFKIFGLLKGDGRNDAAGTEALPYVRKDYLLTKAERAFFDVLFPIVSGKCHLFSMVRLADLIYIRKGTEKRQSYFNRIQSKHIDFVLCNKSELKPILAIELDDSSHQHPDRIKRDEFVDNALEHAGLPLLRIAVRAEYDPKELKQKIQAKLTPNAA